MSSRFANMAKLSDKQDVILNVVCLLFAAFFLFLAAMNFRWAGDFLTTDSLFMTVVFLLLAGVFLVNPALWARERGLYQQWFGLEEQGAAHAPAETIHFEGTAKWFLIVLGYLLALTLVEVFLAYIHVPLTLMLTILIGLSLVKAALIMAYFMHLRYERMSLVFTLIPMLVVCICLLFILFPDGNRSRNLRPYRQTAAEAPAHK